MVKLFSQQRKEYCIVFSSLHKVKSGSDYYNIIILWLYSPFRAKARVTCGQHRVPRNCSLSN